MRRFIASAVAAIFLSSTLAYSQGSGPYSAQIQRAIASLTTGNVNFTQLQCNGSTGTSGQVLIGGNPCTWTGSPSLSGNLTVAGKYFGSNPTNLTGFFPTTTFQNAGRSIFSSAADEEMILMMTDTSAQHQMIFNFDAPSTGAGALTAISYGSLRETFVSYTQGARTGKLELLNAETSTGGMASALLFDGTTDVATMNPAYAFHVGNVIAPTGGVYQYNGSTTLRDVSNGVLGIRTNAETAGITLNVTTNGTLAIGNRTNSAAGLVSADTFVSAGSGVAVANVGANSCGTTAATIAGGNNAFVITVGATSGTQCRVTFTFAAANEWDCAANDDTTTIAVRTTPVDTTHTDIIGGFTAGDKVTGVCFPR